MWLFANGRRLKWNVEAEVEVPIKHGIWNSVDTNFPFGY